MQIFHPFDPYLCPRAQQGFSEKPEIIHVHLVKKGLVKVLNSTNQTRLEHCAIWTINYDR